MPQNAKLKQVIMETKNLNQPQSGVLFDEKSRTANFTLQNCDKGVHLETIKALLNYLSSDNGTICTQNDKYCICNLISSMLPNENQLINL